MVNNSNQKDNSIWNKILYTTRNGKCITIKTVLCIIGIIAVLAITFILAAKIGFEEGRQTAM